MGTLYPFFGTLIGWIGTASTRSDTSSNVLFWQPTGADRSALGMAPVLMAAANSGGGLMSKMTAPQSLVVASTATGIYGNEGGILRRVLTPRTAGDFDGHYDVGNSAPSQVDAHSHA